MSRKIPLTKGFVAIVDDEDFDWLSQWSWSVSGGGYAVRAAPRVKGEQRGILRMHRELLNAPLGLQVDHINRDRLDNRRGNLRICTARENTLNTLRRTGEIAFIGVRLRHENLARPYQVRICTQDGRKTVGYYATAEEGARAYDAAAKAHHGAFAVLNFPEARHG